MNRERRKEEIVASLKLLATIYAEMTCQFEATLATLKRVLELDDPCSTDLLPATVARASSIHSVHRPVADRATFSVEFHDKTCFLGNTLLFRFFEVLLPEAVSIRTAASSS